MKHYESTFEEHILSIEKHNIHPELFDTFSKFPQNVYDFENIIGKELLEEVNEDQQLSPSVLNN